MSRRGRWAAVVITLLALAGPARAQDRLDTRRLAHVPAAAKLAAIDERTEEPTLAKVNQFRLVLVTLNAICTDGSEERIADFLVWGQRRLAEAGIQLSLLSFSGRVVELLGRRELRGFHATCAQPVAAVVTILEAEYAGPGSGPT